MEATKQTIIDLVRQQGAIAGADLAAPRTDCFRLRSKVGLDVALETLKEGWQANCSSVDELMSIATACRIATVIRPHFEMLVA